MKNLQTLRDKLEDFKRAAVALSEAWENCDGDAINNYPKRLPSFDEFVYEILEMEVQS